MRLLSLWSIAWECKMENEEFLKRLKTAYTDPTNKRCVCECVCVCACTYAQMCISRTGIRGRENKWISKNVY